MKTIWKFPLPDIAEEAEFKVPLRSKPILFGLDPQGILAVWYLIPNTNSPTERRVLRVTGTGHPVPDNVVYVGSTVDNGFVWHLWERHAIPEVAS